MSKLEVSKSMSSETKVKVEIPEKTFRNTISVRMSIGDTFIKNDMFYVIKRLSSSHYFAYCYTDSSCSNLTAYEVGRLFTTTIVKRLDKKLFKGLLVENRHKYKVKDGYIGDIEFLEFQHVPENRVFGQDELKCEMSFPFGCEELAVMMFNKTLVDDLKKG